MQKEKLYYLGSDDSFKWYFIKEALKKNNKPQTSTKTSKQTRFHAFLDELFQFIVLHAEFVEGFIACNNMNGQLRWRGAYTTLVLTGHRGHVWRPTWAFQTEVRCGRRVKASRSWSGVALAATFHPSAVHVLVLFEQKLHALDISSFNWASLFGCILILYCSFASTRQLLNEEGKRKLCVTAVQLWPCPLRSGVVTLQSIVWFLLFCMWRWEEVGLKLCQVSGWLFSLPTPERSGQ